jgi:hypothetical protein
MRQLRRTCIVGLAVAVWAAMSPVAATPYQPMANAKGKVGAKIGLVYSTHFRIDGVPSSAGIGISGGVLFDIPLARRMMSGVTIDIHDLHVFEKRKKMLDLSVPLKYRFTFEEHRWELRTVASAGFGYMTLVDKLERTTYLTLKAGFEAVFHTDTRYSLIIDGLILAAPIGGNREHKVTYGPTFLIRAGFIY